MKDTLGIILIKEQFNEMRELTIHRTIASVPFGGRYRLIDFTLSNFVSSGIKTVGIVTRNNYYSLVDHIGSGKEWDLNRKNGGLSVLSPYVGNQNMRGEGKVETIYSVLGYIKNSGCKYVLISDSNIVGSIDYNKFLESHIKKRAYLSVAYKKDVFDASRFYGNTFLQTDDRDRVTGVAINQAIQLYSNMALGAYIIERELLEFLISQCMAHNKFDFERDIVQSMHSELDIFGWCCEGYVERIDSLDVFREVNMSLLNENIRNELFKKGNILTKVHDEVPTYYGSTCYVKNSMLADGCVIEGEVSDSILFRAVTVEDGAKVSNSIVMQGCRIGKNAMVENCILDKNVIVSDGIKVAGATQYPMVIAKGSRL